MNENINGAPRTFYYLLGLFYLQPPLCSQIFSQIQMLAGDTHVTNTLFESLSAEVLTPYVLTLGGRHIGGRSTLLLLCAV
jgi:hypothetical protein